MRNASLGVVLLILLILSAGACQTRSADDTVTVACATREEADALEHLAIEPYRAERPDARIRVVCMYETYNDLPIDVNETLPERVAPRLKDDVDVFAQLSVECVRELREEGAIARLDSYLDRNPEVKTSMALPADSILRAEGDGSLYALAPTFSSLAMAYNADMFDAAGVEYPQGLLTWEEAFALGEEVASKTSARVAAFSFGPQGEAGFYDTFLQLAPSAGVYVVDGDEVAVDDGFAELWDFFMDAEIRYALSKDGRAFWRGEAALALVYNDQVDNPGAFQSDPTFSRFRWDLTETPVFDKANPVSYAAVSSALVMSASSDCKDEAWNLMAYLVGPEFATVLGGMTTSSPFYGSLPSCETGEVVMALRSRADKHYESFYAHAAPRARAFSHHGIGVSYVTTLLQRLVIETLNGRIDGARAAAIISERGPRLYATEEVLDPFEDAEALRELIGY